MSNANASPNAPTFGGHPWSWHFGRAMRVQIGSPADLSRSGTIFGLLRKPIAALDLVARHSRTRSYCSRTRNKIRLALDLLATPKNFKSF